jgi:hypothetical protein
MGYHINTLGSSLMSHGKSQMSQWEIPTQTGINYDVPWYFILQLGKYITSQWDILDFPLVPWVMFNIPMGNAYESWDVPWDMILLSRVFYLNMSWIHSNHLFYQ